MKYLFTFRIIAWICSTKKIKFKTEQPYMLPIYTFNRVLNQVHVPSLTHWGWVRHICICKMIIICSDNGLLLGWRQAIIWTNAGILLIGPLGTNFNEILFETHTYSFHKMHLKMLSVKWWPFCFGLNVLCAVQPFYPDGRNHSVCCANASLPSQCLPFCAGQEVALTAAHLVCVAPHIETIINCMETGHGRI